MLNGLIVTKLFAEADRQEDINDILALNPSDAELDQAYGIVKDYDLNPEWPKHLANTLVRIKNLIKSGVKV